MLHRLLIPPKSLKGLRNGGSASALTYIDSADASTSASIEFDSSDFNATLYDAYCFVLMNIIPATDGDDLFFRTSNDGGSTFDAGASDYNYSSWNYDGVVRADPTTSRIPLNAVVTNYHLGSDAGDDGIGGTVWLHGPHLAKKTKVTWQTGYDADVLTGHAFSIGTGQREAQEVVDGVQFIMSSGTIESGTITMYGMRNA
jgi:hypothetical protein